MTKGIVFDAAPQIGVGIKKLWNGYDKLVGKGVNFVRNKTSSNNRRRLNEMQEPTNQD